MKTVKAWMVHRNGIDLQQVIDSEAFQHGIAIPFFASLGEAMTYASSSKFYNNGENMTATEVEIRPVKRRRKSA